jgi:ATP-dependent Lhr-like helicase
LYDVFVEHDPENRLIDQARREVLERQLEASRLRQALERIGGMRLLVTITERLTPLAFPLWAARIQTSHVSSERWTTRVHRMLERLEKAASATQRKKQPVK